MVGPQVFQSPRLTYSAASTTRRAETRISASARSAVVSVSTPGVLPTGNAPRGAGREIDVVDPDGHLRHHLELRSRRLEHGFVDAVGDQADDAVNAANMFEQVVAPWREVARPDVEFEVGIVAQRDEAFAGQLARDEDPWHRRLRSLRTLSGRATEDRAGAARSLPRSRSSRNGVLEKPPSVTP